MTSAELISAGVDPELLVFLALRRAAGGGVAESGCHYFEWGRPTPSWLAGVFTELVGMGLLARAGKDLAQLRRVSLTQAGRRRYQQLSVSIGRLPR